jgi:hypothetical protein
MTEREQIEAHAKKGIRVDAVCPPIPMRCFDWCAVEDATYDGPGNPIGWGATIEEAVENLREEMELSHDRS